MRFIETGFRDSLPAEPPLTLNVSRHLHSYDVRIYKQIYKFDSTLLFSKGRTCMPSHCPATPCHGACDPRQRVHRWVSSPMSHSRGFTITTHQFFSPLVLLVSSCATSHLGPLGRRDSILGCFGNNAEMSGKETGVVEPCVAEASCPGSCSNSPHSSFASDIMQARVKSLHDCNLGQNHQMEKHITLTAQRIVRSTSA